MDYGVERTAAPREPNGLERIDQAIDELGATAKELEGRLGPVLNQYDMAELRSPVPEPASLIRGRAQGITDVTTRLRELISRLDV